MMTYRLLLVLAAVMGLAWTFPAPAASLSGDSLVLQPRQPLQRDALEELLDANASAQVDGERVTFEASAPGFPLTNAALEPVRIRVVTLDMVDGGERFLANVEVAVGAQGPRNIMPVSGRAIRERQVPVLRRARERGAILSANDLTFAWVRSPAQNGRVSADIASMVGKELLRDIDQDRPIRIGDLREPLAVQRGQMVTVEFERGALRIAARARALEEGARGDVVRVENLHNDHVIRAEIIGAGRLRIAGGSSRSGR